MSIIKPFPYQKEANDALVRYFVENKTGNPVIDAPTGSGKSVIIATFIHMVLSNWPGQRVLMLTHQKELIEQNEEKLLKVWPDAPVGVYSASVGRKQLFQPIIFAGIQSLARSRHIPRFDLVLIDECHLVPFLDADSQYRKVIRKLQQNNPHVRFIGLTATPFRTAGGYIHTHPSSLFTDICHEISIHTLIELGRIAPVVTRASEHELDESQLKKRGGEFTEQSINLQFKDRADSITDEIIERGRHRKKWLLFTSGVEQACVAADLLSDKGIRTGVVHGKLSKGEREAIINDLKFGDLKAVVNCNVLTTGFDAPEIDLVALLRATTSANLYVQMIGRGMRVAPGKENCLALDYGGNCERHGPIDNLNIRAEYEREKSESDAPRMAPQKRCANCDTFNPISARLCLECGEEFPRSNPWDKLTPRSNGADIISKPKAPEWKNVDRVSVSRHVSRRQTESMRVDYRCGMLIVSEWFALSSRFGAGRALSFLKEINYPEAFEHDFLSRAATDIQSVCDGVQASIDAGIATPPKSILVDHSGKFAEIKHRSLNQMAAA